MKNHWLILGIIVAIVVISRNANASSLPHTAVVQSNYSPPVYNDIPALTLEVIRRANQNTTG